MSITNKIIPELRFPDYTDKWSEQRVGAYLVEYRKKSTVENQHPVMTSSNKGLMLQSEYYGENRITDRNNVGFNIIPPNYITYRSRSDTRQFTFNINELNETGLISVYYPVFSTEGMSKRFIVELLNSRKHYVGKYSVGTSQTVLSYNELCRLKLPLPSRDEQKKIVAFLSAMEKRGVELEKKRNLLKDYKKGLMQQLFDQTLRFTNDHGQPFPDWEERTFASLYDFESTNSYSRDMLNYEAGSVSNVHYGDIHTKFKSLFSIEDENVPLIDPSIDLSRIREGQYLQEGDLVIADASEDYADIGKSIEVINLGGTKAVAGLHTILARKKNTDQIFLGFGAYLMQSEGIRLNIKRIAQGIKVLGLSSTRVGAIEVRIPHPDEQKKIVHCLSTIDRQVQQAEAQVSGMQEFKKGLLQKMFV